MGELKFEISISLDGFVAGPNQSEENPIGEGGMRLHDWVFKLRSWRHAHGREGGEANASDELIEKSLENIGAHLMGRNMFGGGPGPWGEEPWDGWWGEEPPFHTPTFVVTHHQRPPLELTGGTTFFFVTDGVEAAVAQALEAAGGKDVKLGGGANVAQQCLAAGLVDELQLNVVPLLLGAGERLFENVGANLGLEQTLCVATPDVTHLRYRVSKGV